MGMWHLRLSGVEGQQDFILARFHVLRQHGFESSSIGMAVRYLGDTIFCRYFPWLSPKAPKSRVSVVRKPNCRTSSQPQIVNIWL